MATDQVSILNNRVVVWKPTGTLILELEVIGTHFPAKSSEMSFSSADLVLENLPSLDSSIEVNYNDGTGIHSYPFIASGATRKIEFIRNENRSIQDTPSNISGTGIFNYPVYFFQDLPLPSGTIDDFYSHSRKITIKFNRFQDLKIFSISGTGLHGNIPASLGRFRNLETLEISNARTLTGIDADFTKVFCKVFSLGLLGFLLGDEIPQFILNSSSITNLNLGYMLDFSGKSPETSRLTELFSSLLPNLNMVSLRGCNINFQLPNLQRDFTGKLNFSVNEGLEFKLSPDLSTYLGNIVLDGSLMATAEYIRIIQNAPSYKINILNIVCDSDIDIASPNAFCEEITIGRNTLFGGVVPSFLAKMQVLNMLSITDQGNNMTYSNITSWGNGISDSITFLQVSNMIGLPPTLPTWFGGLVNLMVFESFFTHTQTRMNDHLDSFYSIVEANAPMTGIGIFRGLTAKFINNVNSQNINPRPTGTYQAPTGYIQGSANGTPASQMEMIWVLVHQYEMIVSVLNEAGNGIDIYTI